MGLRLSDMTIVGLILMALLFFGSIILLYQVVTLNYIKPFSVSVVIFSILFGLGIGIITGWFPTRYQLKILKTKGEYKLTDSKVSVFANVVGLAVFLIVCLLVSTLGLAFEVGEIFFVFSALFTLFIVRMALIAQFERQTKKAVMTQFGIFSNRLYIYPDTTDSAH